MKLHKKILCIAGLGILLGSTSLFAAEKTLKDIVNNAYAQIGGMDKYAFTALVLDSELQEDGTVKQYRHDVSVKVDRPAKLRVDTQGDNLDRTSYSNSDFVLVAPKGVSEISISSVN